MVEWKRYLWTAIGFLVVMLALSPSIVLNPTTTVIGAEGSDIWAHIWGNWRTEYSLRTTGQLPYQEHHLNYPHGGDLYHVDLLNSLLSIPLRWIFPPLLAQNILILAHWIGAALSMILLCRFLNVSWISSTFAAVGYAFSPFVLAFPLASGVTERMHLLWLPLYVLCFLKLSDSKQPRWIVAAALCYAFSIVGSWHYGMFLFLMTIPLVLVHVFTHSESIVQACRELFVPYASLAVLCGLATIPVGQMAIQSIKQEAMIDRSFTVLWDWNSRIEMLNDFAVVDLFAPRSDGLLVSQGFDLLYETIYIGYTLPLLTVVSLFSKRRYARFFPACALFFIVLSLGSEIRLMDGGQSYYSPVLYATAAVVPFFLGLEVPWEHILPALFFLSLSGAFGLEILREKWGSSTKALIPVGVLSLEWLFLGPALIPIPSATIEVPAIYHQIAEEEGTFAVFDFPALRVRSQLAPEVYLLYQTVHERPIPYSIQQSWLHTDPLWRTMMLLQHKEPNGTISEEFRQCRGPGCARIENIRPDLIEKGFRYFIVHLDLLLPEVKKKQQDFWRMVLGEPVLQSSQMEVFLLSSKQ